MFQNIIKIDYSLSVWFSKTSDKIIPGTAFLFLNKVAFIWISLIIYTFSTSMWVGVGALGALLIIFWFQEKNRGLFATNQASNKEKSHPWFSFFVLLILSNFCCGYFIPLEHYSLWQEITYYIILKRWSFISLSI